MTGTTKASVRVTVVTIHDPPRDGTMFSADVGSGNGDEWRLRDDPTPDRTREALREAGFVLVRDAEKLVNET